MEIILVGLLSYLSGSIPFGLILTKVFGGQDVRKIGSGNIGATNVLRTGNKLLAAITLIFDILKGYIPATITLRYYPELIQFSCLITFFGHIFPIWLKFHGGKGVATYLGILFAISLQLSFLFIFTWLVTSLIFKYSSISSLFATLTVFVIYSIKKIIEPVFFKVLGKNVSSNLDSNNFTLLLFVFLILIIFTHRKNILNLKNRKEHKIKL